MADELGSRRLAQPDQRSCGAAVLVVARLLADPAYGRFVATDEAFRSEVLAMHRRVASAADVRGRMQLPWPRALGTPPWAVARQLEATTGTAHRVQVARWDGPAAFDAVAAATGVSPVPCYVGSRLLPRHVVLALGAEGDRLRCYEPASGRVVGVDRVAFVGSRLALAGWDVAWFSVLPSGRRTPA